MRRVIGYLLLILVTITIGLAVGVYVIKGYQRIFDAEQTKTGEFLDYERP